jgi:hypothetical protein
MPVLQWLREKVYFDLPEQDVEAIRDFALLYSLFEAKALNEDGRPLRLVAAVDAWQAQGTLDPARFEIPIAYFKHRYFPDGQEGPRFPELHVADAYRARVAAALSGANADPKEAVIAALLVTNRLRNNLMHGPKWAYGLAGQHDNFHHANLTLMAALDTNALNM